MDRLEDLEMLSANGCLGERLSRCEEDAVLVERLQARLSAAETRISMLERTLAAVAAAISAGPP